MVVQGQPWDLSFMDEDLGSPLNMWVGIHLLLKYLLSFCVPVTLGTRNTGVENLRGRLHGQMGM